MGCLCDLGFAVVVLSIANLMFCWWMWWHKNLNWLSTKVKIVLVMKMKTKAIYEGDVLKPIGEFDLKDGLKVEIEVKKKITERTFGIIQLEHDEIEEIISDTEYGSW